MRHDVIVGDGGVFFPIEGLLVQVPRVLGVVRRIRDVDVVRSINEHLTKTNLDAKGRYDDGDEPNGVSESGAARAASEGQSGIHYY